MRCLGCYLGSTRIFLLGLALKRWVIRHFGILSGYYYCLRVARPNWLIGLDENFWGFLCNIFEVIRHGFDWEISNGYYYCLSEVFFIIINIIIIIIAFLIFFSSFVLLVENNIYILIIYLYAFLYYLIFILFYRYILIFLFANYWTLLGFLKRFMNNWTIFDIFMDFWKLMNILFINVKDNFYYINVIL